MKPIKTIQSLILCALSLSAIIQAETNQPQETPSAKQELPSNKQEVTLTPAQKAEIIKIIEFAEKGLTK